MAEKKERKRLELDVDQAIDTTERRTREVAGNFNSVLRAWSEATVELWSAAPRVAGDVMDDVGDALLGRGERGEKRSGVFESAAGTVRDLSRSVARGWRDTVRAFGDSASRFVEAYQGRRKSPEPPSFIWSDGNEQMPTPYVFRRMGIRFFALEADKAKLQAICDRYLNIAPKRQLHYRPLGNYVLLQMNSVDNFASVNEPFSQFGHFSQKEVAFTLILLQTRHGLPSLAYYPTYFTLDNSWSIASGREVLGYQKAFGRLTIPEDLRNPAPSLVETMVFDPYSPETKLSYAPLLEVKKRPLFAAEAREKVFASLDELSTDIREDTFDIVRMTEDEIKTRNTFQLGQFPFISLKQFRDAEQQDKACYQAIVKADLVAKDIHGMGLLSGAYTLKLHDYDSLPIARELGLQRTSSGNVRIIGKPFWVDADWGLEDVKNRYIAGG